MGRLRHRLRPALDGFDQAGLILALLLTLAGLAYFWTPTDPDVWWHLQNGRLVWTLGHVPMSDLYSYTVPGTRWIMQQWLLEAAMYAIEQTLGYWANVLLFALVTISVYGLLFRVLRAEGAGRPLAAAVLGAALVLDAPTWGVRPQVWTTLFTLIFLAVLLRYHRVGPDRRLWLLPPLMLLWANIHAGFTVGILVLGAALAGETINRLFGWSRLPLRPLLLVTLACAAVSLLNPNGLDLWLYPLTYLGGPGGNPSLRYVQEWQPPNLRALAALPLLTSLIGLLVLNVVRRANRAPVPDEKGGGPARFHASNAMLLLVLGGFTLMALQAGRFLPLYGLIWAVAIAGRAVDLWPRLGDRAAVALREEAILPAANSELRTPNSELLKARLNAVIYGVVSLGVAGVMLGNGRAQIHAGPLERDYPAAAVAYLSTQRATLPQPVHLFHEYGWGGYLIAQGWPVFIDGRADPYNPIFDRYIAAAGGSGWADLFREYRVNAVLIHPYASLDPILAADPHWRRAYADSQAVLYLAR